MNSIAKITIPVEKIYAAINSADVLNAQSIIERNSVADEANSVRNVTEYNSMAAAIKQVNDAIKIVESARKEVTAPIDHFKKELIALERQTVDRLNTFIASAKVKMLDYHNEVERQHKEAEAKIKAEAEAKMSLKGHFKEMDVLANMVDDLYVSSVEMAKTKNIRTLYKAEVDGNVDWLTIIEVLFSTEHLRKEDLLRHLPKAMQMAGVNQISGIKIVEIKTQTV
jgi:predicted RND superfamily exporter protein